MWIKHQHFRQISHALQDGKQSKIDQALAELVDLDHSPNEIPSACPSCRRELICSPLPYVELFVSSCPEHHGVWMSPVVWKKLKELMSYQISVDEKKKFCLKVLSQIALILMVGFSGLIVLIYSPRAVLDYFHQKHLNAQSMKISETDWPLRSSSDFPPIPLKESRIDQHQDLLYFERLSSILELGISNRLNMDLVLRTERKPSTRYRDLYLFYAEKQSEFSAELKDLEPPAHLRQFHGLILEAVEEQTYFYGDYAEEKIRSKTAKLNQMLDHPALISSSKKLHDAYAIFKAIYPELDRATDEAIERRLCWMDII